MRKPEADDLALVVNRQLVAAIGPKRLVRINGAVDRQRILAAVAIRVFEDDLLHVTPEIFAATDGERNRDGGKRALGGIVITVRRAANGEAGITGLAFGTAETIEAGGVFVHVFYWLNLLLRQITSKRFLHQWEL